MTEAPFYPPALGVPAGICGPGAAGDGAPARRVGGGVAAVEAIRLYAEVARAFLA